MDILPSAVEPSSGIFVCCSYGKKQSIVINFKDGSRIEFTGKDFNKENLKEYCDERFNKHNEKEVESVDLFSPQYVFDGDVVLIDSPGLNAYDLEAHEKLTLELLVPTIDICMYLTTTKTNSDANTLEVLNTVSRYKCPIIIVQNKLDAVEGSPDGKKSKQEVTKEHLNRLKKVIDNSFIEDKDRVGLIQISAINALKWKISNNGQKPGGISKEDYNKSNFEQFLKITKEMIDAFRPLAESVRNENLYGSIDEITNEISERLNSAKKTGPVKKSCDYDEKIIELENYSSINLQNLTNLSEKVTQVISNHLSIGVDRLDEDTVETYVDFANQIVGGLGNEIYEFIKEANRNIRKYAGYAHIPERELYGIPQVQDYKRIDVLTYETEELVREKKAGFDNALSRMFSIFNQDKNAGYDVHVEKVIRNDVEETKENADIFLKYEHSRYLTIISDWGNNTQRLCERIKKILSEERDAYYLRQEALKEEKVLKPLYEKLRGIKDIAKRNIKKCEKWVFTDIHVEQKLSEINADDIICDFFELEKSLRKKQNAEVMKTLVEYERLEKYDPILLGWDEDCENKFNWNVGIKDLRVINLIKEEAPKEGDGVDTCFFVLVSASQIGMEKKKVKNLELTNVVEPNDYVIWVVQDFDELLNSGSVEEGLRNMLWLEEFSGIGGRGSIVWINHDTPVYNISFLEQQMFPKTSVTEKQDFLDQLKKKFGIFCDEFSMGVIAKNILEVNA